jgi:hypothetical protein
MDRSCTHGTDRSIMHLLMKGLKWAAGITYRCTGHLEHVFIGILQAVCCSPAVVVLPLTGASELNRWAECRSRTNHREEERHDLAARMFAGSRTQNR